MRSLIFTIVFSLISFSAKACPDLSGGYLHCRSSTGAVDESRDLIIQQRIEGGVTIYTAVATYVNDQDREHKSARADGRDVVTEETWGDGAKAIVINNLSCQGRTLVQTHQFTVQGSQGIEYNFRTVISKNGHQLKMVFTGSSDGQPVNDVVICE